MPDIKYVPQRDALQIRLEGTGIPYVIWQRGAFYTYYTRVPRYGDAVYIYNRHQYGAEMPDFWSLHIKKLVRS